MSNGFIAGDQAVDIKYLYSTAWLLEVAVPGVHLYFGCGGCDVGAGNAIRFSRKEDALDMLTTLERLHVVAKGCYIATEHQWAAPDVNT